jgi:hypothetical protein
LGHADTRVTQRYAHLSSDTLLLAADTVSDKLSSLKQPQLEIVKTEKQLSKFGKLGGQVCRNFAHLVHSVSHIHEMGCSLPYPLSPEKRRAIILLYSLM